MINYGLNAELRPPNNVGLKAHDDLIGITFNQNIVHHYH